MSKFRNTQKPMLLALFATMPGSEKFSLALQAMNLAIFSWKKSTTFSTIWDFDRPVSLSREIFQEQEMFGEKKYVYRPNIGINNIVLWNGLSSFKMVIPSSPQIESSLDKNTLFLRVRFETDSHGFKPTGFTWQPGKKAVFFLGDSFTEGLWTAPEATFASQFGKMQNAKAGVIPINLGVNGYSALEMDWMLEKYAPEFQPVIAVANLFLNDVDGDYYGVLTGKVVPESSYKAMLAHLEHMRVFCKENSIILVVSIIPPKEQFLFDIPDNSPFYEHVRHWAEANRVIYLDAREYFRARNPRRLYLSWDPHFSQEGHAVYARFLQEHLHPFLEN